MDLSNLVGNTGVASTIYYAGIIIGAIFLAGFYLRTKLSHLCQEANDELEKRMNKFEDRLTKHEFEAVKISNYERDMSNVRSLFVDIKTDLKEGFANINKRMDDFLLERAQT